MAFARRRAPWARTIPDLHRSLVRAYTQLIFMPVQSDGSRSAVIARFGTRDVCLVENIAAEAAPEDMMLRLELFDHAVGHAVESVTCNDLEEAEAAIGVLVTDLARLSEELHGLEVIGPWFIEARTFPSWPEGERAVCLLDAAEIWLRAGLPSREASYARA
ncbi:hypothetical protein [Methylobacterium sp. CM6257]